MGMDGVRISECGEARRREKLLVSAAPMPAVSAVPVHRRPYADVRPCTRVRAFVPVHPCRSTYINMKTMITKFTSVSSIQSTYTSHEYCRRDCFSSSLWIMERPRESEHAVHMWSEVRATKQGGTRGSRRAGYLSRGSGSSCNNRNNSHNSSPPSSGVCWGRRRWVPRR